MSMICIPHPHGATGKVLHTLLWGVLLCGLTYGQVQEGQSDKAAAAIDKDKLLETIDKAKQDNPESIYFVEQLARGGAVQAVPMLEEKFARTQDPLDKAHIASALVRLGDKNDTYWNFLLKLATRAVESDAPDYMSYDAQGKSLRRPSPEFEAWVKAHHLAPDEAQEQLVLLPGAVGFLARTRDSRAVPLLRRALLSPNYMTEIWAAWGLADLHDKDSIPLIIEACRKAPSEVAAVIARALVYFDTPEAQSAVDEYMPADDAKINRDARAKGRKSPWGD